MEDVLDLYAEPPDPARPVVCLDESPVQLIGQVREPIPAAPGQVARVDYEYRRNGTMNLFVVMDVHRPWRKVTVTERRTSQDYAVRLRELVDVDFPDAERIRVVQDNLSTHTPARSMRPSRLLRRVASWGGWSSTTPPNTRAGSTWSRSRSASSRASAWTAASTRATRSSAEIAAWERERNAAGARVKWMFTTEQARAKMGRAYPKPNRHSQAARQNHNHCAEELAARRWR